MQKQDKDALLDKLCNAIFDEKVLPWHLTYKGMPKNLSTDKLYTGINRLLLNITSDPIKVFFTQKQLPKQYSIREEELNKPMGIMFYQPVNTVDKDTGKRSTFPVIKTYKVYNVSQLNEVDPAFQKYRVPLTEVEQSVYNDLEKRAIDTLPKVVNKFVYDKLSDTEKELITKLAVSYTLVSNNQKEKIQLDDNQVNFWVRFLRENKGIILSCAGKAQKIADRILGN